MIPLPDGGIIIPGGDNGDDGTSPPINFPSQDDGGNTQPTQKPDTHSGHTFSTQMTDTEA